MRRHKEFLHSLGTCKAKDKRYPASWCVNVSCVFVVWLVHSGCRAARSRVAPWPSRVGNGMGIAIGVVSLLLALPGGLTPRFDPRFFGAPLRLARSNRCRTWDGHASPPAGTAPLPLSLRCTYTTHSSHARSTLARGQSSVETLREVRVHGNARPSCRYLRVLRLWDTCRAMPCAHTGRQAPAPVSISSHDHPPSPPPSEHIPSSTPHARACVTEAWRRLACRVVSATQDAPRSRRRRSHRRP
jgi:hypothetical protein